MRRRNTAQCPRRVRARQLGPSHKPDPASVQKFAHTQMLFSLQSSTVALSETMTETETDAKVRRLTGCTSMSSPPQSPIVKAGSPVPHKASKAGTMSA